MKNGQARWREGDHVEIVHQSPLEDYMLPPLSGLNYSMARYRATLAANWLANESASSWINWRRCEELVSLQQHSRERN